MPTPARLSFRRRPPTRRVAFRRLAAAAAMALVTGGCAATASADPTTCLPTTRPSATQPATAPSAPPSRPSRIDSTNAWLLHVPGIAGESVIDHTLFAGMRDAGFAGPLVVYDWTGIRKGIAALVNREQNDAEAQKVAERIIDQRRRDPNGQIIVTGHSGGTGIVVFALEKLPPGVTVDGVLLLSPALSPNYDLSRALSKVRGRMYVFSSNLDLFVLGLGTKVFGTIDRKQGDSAGRVGFVQPEAAADPKQYQKLVGCPYEKGWVRYDNIGDHVGVMSRSFSSHVLCPLVLSLLPGSPGPMTRPTTVPTTRPGK